MEGDGSDSQITMSPSLAYSCSQISLRANLRETTASLALITILIKVKEAVALRGTPLSKIKLTKYDRDDEIVICETLPGRKSSLQKGGKSEKS